MKHPKLPERIRALEAEVARAAGIKAPELRKEMRDRTIVNARAMIWFVAHTEMGYPANRLAKMYDRDHTTILHHINRLHGTEEAVHVVSWLREKTPALFAKDGGNAGFIKDWDLD